MSASESSTGIKWTNIQGNWLKRVIGASQVWAESVIVQLESVSMLSSVHSGELASPVAYESCGFVYK